MKKNFWNLQLVIILFNQNHLHKRISDKKTDISLNYNPNATIRTTYYDRSRVPDPDFVKDLPITKLSSRKKGACVFISNCASERMDFINKLSAIYPIRSFGACLHNETLPTISYKMKDPKTEIKQIALKTCKYSLSFESFSLPYYVTEKIFDSIKANSLSIYRGAPNIEDLIPLNEMPVVNANNMTPAELGGLLKSLDENDSAYRSYFERTLSAQGKMKLESMRDHAFDANVCGICTAVAEMKYARKLLDEILGIQNTASDGIFKISESQIQKFIKEKELDSEDSKLLMEIYLHAYGSFWNNANANLNWNNPKYFLKNPKWM